MACLATRIWRRRGGQSGDFSGAAWLCVAALRESGAADSAALADLMAAESGKNRDR